jgi:hypothetical protein
MNNERYLRVSHDEQADFELEHGHAALPDDEIEDSEHHKQFSSTWRNQRNQHNHFHPVAQQDEADEEDQGEQGLGLGRDPPNACATQIRVKSSPASSHHGSEGFLDDDMDDLSRYQLDFSDTSMARNLRESTSLEESVARGQINLALLQQAYHQTQLETRRKRVDQLLSVTTESEKLWISISSWCDIYDRGLCLLIVLTGMWLSLTTLLKQPLWTTLGVLFFVMRLAAKPLYWYLQGRHIARKRKVTMQIYEEVNQLGMELTPNKNIRIDDGDDSPPTHQREQAVLVQQNFTA